MELEEVERLFVFPSCGDETNPIGASYHLAAAAGEPGAVASRPLLGSEFSAEMKPPASTHRFSVPVTAATAPERR